MSCDNQRCMIITWINYVELRFEICLMDELCRVGTLVTTGSGFGVYVKSMVLDLLWDYCLVCLWDING